MECSENNWGIWQCIDCTLSRSICRHCMRHTHRQSPFHQIECWTGLYYRHVALWEVGTYILVEHHTNIAVCEGLKFQTAFLEKLQLKKDKEEQDKILQMHAASASGLGSATWCTTDSVDAPVAECHDELGEDHEDMEQGVMSDVDFLHWLDTCHENRTESDNLGHGDFTDGTDIDDGDAAEADIPGFIQYLDPSNRSSHREADADADYVDPGSRPKADALNNTYVCIVHTNGIHHLAMVTCLCHGEHNVPLNLVAS
jgi:hypothetical protein